ncbi:MAG: flagellar filament capping protein FliD, partial [Lachnospiraceae bacterium]|nr:flagellar filament capping protein FliD [Lachnospiraceae bacterium]
MDSVQSLKINQLAKVGYLTGAEIKGDDGKKLALSSSSKVVESLGIVAGSMFEVSTKGKKTEITIDENTTINSLVNQLKSAGVNANFDAGQQRFYIGASALGEDADFTIIGSNSNGTTALKKLGILIYDKKAKDAYEEYATMSADDIKALKQSRIDARVASMVAERDSLTKKNEELTDKLKECIEEYNEAYGKNGKYDLENEDTSDPDSRVGRKAFLTSEVARYGAIGPLSAEDQADLDKIKAELSYINGYEELQKDIKANSDRLDVINSYVDGDGNAKVKLEGEVGTEVDQKITEAINIYNSYGTNDSMAGSAGANKQVGQRAEIELNGVQYFSESNTLDINGLTITCNGETAPNEVITLTTKNDTNGIYDMIKSFIKEYSALINEMDKLYNAESAKGYEPLTDDEKEAMSESEIEKWESKIKNSLL